MKLIEGEKLFDLKAQNGLPLDFSVAICADRGVVVEWPSFIRRARANGWFDFQTIREITFAVTDAYLDRKHAEQIVERAKLFMLKEPIEW